MNTLYITDLDGTLLNSSGNLSENSRKMISDFIENGANFTVATARTFATVKEMFKGIDLKLPLVLMNGVMLYSISDDRVVTYHNINENAVTRVLEIYKKHGAYPMLYRCVKNGLEIEYFSKDNPYQMKYIGNRDEINGKRFLYSPVFDSENNKNIIYIVTLDEYEKLLPIYNDIKKSDDVSCAFYSDNYTGCYFMEVFASGVSKASTLLEVKNTIKADRVIAFGDNLNDMEMFRIADEAYAVENACEELKAIATETIGCNNDDSVANYISKHFAENKNL